MGDGYAAIQRGEGCLYRAVEEVYNRVKVERRVAIQINDLILLANERSCFKLR